MHDKTRKRHSFAHIVSQPQIFYTQNILFRSVVSTAYTILLQLRRKKKREKPKCSEIIVLWVHLHLTNSLSTSVLNHMVYGYQHRRSEANFDSRKGNETFLNKSHAFLFKVFTFWLISVSHCHAIICPVKLINQYIT